MVAAWYPKPSTQYVNGVSGKTGKRSACPGLEPHPEKKKCFGFRV